MHPLTTSYTSATQSIDGRLSLSSISPLRPLRPLRGRWEPSDGNSLTDTAAGRAVARSAPHGGDGDRSEGLSASNSTPVSVALPI